MENFCTTSFKKLVKRYGTNLSRINIDNVSLAGCDLRNVKLRKDRNLFQKIQDRNLCGTKMPTRDYSRFNFKGVLIKMTSFSEESVLPKNKDLFQKVKGKNLSFSKLPCADFSEYNFKNVCIKGTIFPKGAVLPKDYGLFRDIKYKDIRETVLPIETLNELHLYDTSEVQIDLEKYNLTPSQLFIILKKHNCDE